MDTSAHWDLIHTERARIARLLDGLSVAQWRADSLCEDWSVEKVVAHLTAAANTGTWAWVRSILRAGFNAGRHNDRLLAKYLGGTPGETLAAFRRSVTSVAAPMRAYSAALGEVIVHGQDIARPLGIDLVPDPAAVMDVAEFFASKDFAVNSRSLVTGLALEADDASFAVGAGPLVRGRLLDLVMAMASRPTYCDDLVGPGVEELRRRHIGL